MHNSMLFHIVWREMVGKMSGVWNAPECARYHCDYRLDITPVGEGELKKMGRERMELYRYNYGGEKRFGCIRAHWHASLENLPPGAASGSAVLERLHTEMKKACPRKGLIGNVMACLQANFYPNCRDYYASQPQDHPSSFPQKLNTTLIHARPHVPPPAEGERRQVTADEIVAEYLKRKEEGSAANIFELKHFHNGHCSEVNAEQAKKSKQ